MNRFQVAFPITREQQRPIRLPRALRKLNPQVLLRMSGSAMTRARPKENRAASARPDLRSGVRSRHFASGLNQPDWSEPPPMAIGFFDYLREKRSSLHPRLISKMPQSLPLATSVEWNALPGWKTNRRSWCCHQGINPVACRPRLFCVFRACRAGARRRRDSTDSDVLLKGTRRRRIYGYFPPLNPPT